MVNTYKFVIPKVIGTVVSSAIAAYGFSRFQFKARGFWFALMLSTLFLPQVVLNVPQFLLFTKWGWVDSYLPLVVPSFFACDTYFVFMLVQFMRGISRELEEAAEIDGCNKAQTIFKIILPLSLPSLVSTGLYAFINAWNEFMFGYIFISTDKYRTLTPAIMLFKGVNTVDWGGLMAGSVVAVIPVTFIFLFLQRYFLAGLMSGSVKG